MLFAENERDEKMMPNDNSYLAGQRTDMPNAIKAFHITPRMNLFVYHFSYQLNLYRFIIVKKKKYILIIKYKV